MANYVSPYSNENYPISPMPFWPGSFVSTRCGHVFSKFQIEAWMREQNRSDCPMCFNEIGELTPVAISTDNIATNCFQSSSSSTYSSKPKTRAREEKNYYQDESEDEVLKRVLKKSKIETHFCQELDPAFEPGLEEAINASLSAPQEDLYSTYSSNISSSLTTSSSSCSSYSSNLSSSSSWSSSSSSQPSSYSLYPTLNSVTSSCSSISSSSAPSAPTLRTTTESDWSVGSHGDLDEFFVKIQTSIIQFNSDLMSTGTYTESQIARMLVTNARAAITEFNNTLTSNRRPLTSRATSSMQDDNLSARKKNISDATKKLCGSLNGLRTTLLQNQSSISQYDYTNLDKALVTLSLTSEAAMQDWDFQIVVPPKPSDRNDVPRRTSCSLVQILKSVFGFRAS